uniref:DUF1618 domain-containing protein n=3 Tax=Aegilops tauschii subsp. strangulata TaxID=200361 RepID=A0A453CN66_AEGTS
IQEKAPTHAVTAATTMPMDPPDEFRRPFWVLLHIHAYARRSRKSAAAEGRGRNNEILRASLLPNHPPHPSNLYLYRKNGPFGDTPCVLSMVDSLILFHAYTGPELRFPPARLCDFFVYRADPNEPSLKLLPHPPCSVDRDDPFGIFPRGDKHYTIASLVPSISSAYDHVLHLFDSETQIWSRKDLIVASPQANFPVDAPVSTKQILSQHHTSTVITLGGTIAWVDLWRGIVFCDMLSEHHALSGVPLPLPLTLGPARHYRGIALLGGCIRLVEVDSEIVDLPGTCDGETGWPIGRTENWTITTWINKSDKGERNSYAAWDKVTTLRGSDIILGDHSVKLPIGLQNLFVSDPAISMDDGDGDVVYLTARQKYMHPKSWVLAVDTRNRKVQNIAYSGHLPAGMPRIDGNYCTCSISN